MPANADSFDRDLQRIAIDIEARSQAVFVESMNEAKRSIVEGSEITGAPGQPVDENNLRPSWFLRFLGPLEAVIATNTVYAESNEDGIARPHGGPYRLLSAVGGRWSVAKTIAGMQRIIEVVSRRLASRPA